ncbi:MAG: TonB family protein [Deltaproteobacteria bacterium]|nr:TonB family protein [Deltaproteobacteria bacterium]
MANNRLLASYLAFSLLLHGVAFLLASAVPVRAPGPGDVLVMDLADIPRATDFRPPRPGIIRGEKRKSPPPPRTARAPKAEKGRPIPPRVLEGRVPDLPVDPNLPPEKAFPAPRAKTGSPPPAKGTGDASSTLNEELLKTARLEPTPEFGKSPPSAPRPAGGTKAMPPGTDLTPSLGKTVMALATRGSRGPGFKAATGSAVGTEGKARDKGEIAEERGGGTHLTALNAPEIQYISYFAAIKRKIELVWQYPYDAQVQGIQGELTIDFAIGRSGSLVAVELIRGSGHRILDDEALRAIRSAAPFDPIPSQYKIPDLRIQAHFIYEMHALRIR